MEHSQLGVGDTEIVCFVAVEALVCPYRWEV